MSGHCKRKAGLSERLAPTRWLVRPGVDLGNFPVTAYDEFVFVDAKNTTCINYDGVVVPMLGGVQ